MNILLLRRSALLFAFGTLTVLSAGCVLSTGGYGYDDGGGYGAAYYEPYGVEYGGWGPDYHVAPYRGGEHRPVGGGGHKSTHAYRTAPASRSMPSLPAHGGGGHGGGKGRDGGGGERH